MAIIGIIAEYNPFHNGHAYQMAEARKQFSQTAPIVVALSGNFTQRGEPALASKWLRTRMALAAGADLVLELPFSFACASAGRFASGGVNLLAATGLVDTLVFGSEEDNLTILEALAEILLCEPPLFQEQLKAFLAQGFSYPRAREEALVAVALEQALTTSDHCRKLLRAPNSILALEYLLSIKKDNLPLSPYLLLRQGSGYHEKQLSTTFSSATAIRQVIWENQTSSLTQAHTATLATALKGHMPDESLAILLAEWNRGTKAVFWQNLAAHAVLNLRAQSGEDLSPWAYMNDGVSGRLLHTAQKLRLNPENDLWSSFLEKAHSKRHSTTRLQRAMVSMLCGHRQRDLEEQTAPAYLRVLGFSSQGKNLLRKMRSSASLPIITKASDFLEHKGNSHLERQAELDLLSAEVWNQAAGYIYGDEYQRQVQPFKAKKLELL